MMIHCKRLLKQVMTGTYGALVFSCGGEPEFQIKDDTVYYKTSNYKDLRHHEDFQKLDADANTFRILKDGSYAKDDRAVFYHEKAITGADAATFEAIGKMMGRDKN